MQLAVEPTDQIQLADMPEIALRVRGLDAAGDDDTNERKTGVGDEIAHASADASRINDQLGGGARPSPHNGGVAIMVFSRSTIST